MACSLGPSPSTRQVPGSSPGPGGRAACAFFLHPPFLPPSGDSFFRTFPTQPTVRLGLIWLKPHRDWAIGSKDTNSWRIEQTIRNKLSALLGCILKTVFASSDSFWLIMSHLRNAWPTDILMPFSGSLLQDAELVFKTVDKFEIAHKTCSILVCDAIPP